MVSAQTEGEPSLYQSIDIIIELSPSPVVDYQKLLAHCHKAVQLVVRQQGRNVIKCNKKMYKWENRLSVITVKLVVRF